MLRSDTSIRFTANEVREALELGIDLDGVKFRQRSHSLGRDAGRAASGSPAQARSGSGKGERRRATASTQRRAFFKLP
jgi:hypothetical protein